MASALLAVTATAAGKPAVDSTLSTNLHTRDKPFFAFGHVRSDDPRCKKHRRVTLINETAGRNVGHFVTAKHGVWRVYLPKHLAGTGNGRSVELYSRVQSRHGPHVKCRAARSGTRPYPPRA
jgi:hypothetical protein